MEVLGWILIGLVAGVIARILVPGRERLGFLLTIVVGLIGSLLGGLVADLLIKREEVWDPAGLLGSILGAVVVLLLFRAWANRRGATWSRRRRATWR